MYYFDSSALVKLIMPEMGSEDLAQFIGRKPLLVSSALVRTEVARTVFRYSPQLMSLVGALLSRIDLIPVDTEALDAAGTLAPASLRSLDSIHLASALFVRDQLDAFVSYDARQLDAASALGLPIASPGA